MTQLVNEPYAENTYSFKLFLLTNNSKDNILSNVVKRRRI